MQRLPESLHDLSPTARRSCVRLIDRATRVNCLSVEKVQPAAVGDMRPLIFEAILQKLIRSAAVSGSRRGRQLCAPTT